MYHTVRQQAKHLSRQQYEILRDLTHAAKNLYNCAVYAIRQHYFSTRQYLRYESVYGLLKRSPEYKALNSNMAQQILKEADGAFRSFFGLLKLAAAHKYDYRDIRIPGYLPKDGHMALVVGMIRTSGGVFTLPVSNGWKKANPGAPAVSFRMPPVLDGKRLKEIRIIPRSDARFFEVQYTYEEETAVHALDTDKALAIDLGVDNLMACADSEGHAFIIDGRAAKARNQWYNRQAARLASVKAKQGIKGMTKRMEALRHKRACYMNDYMSKAARIVTDYCLSNGIGVLVLGYNPCFQRKVALGKTAKQGFLMLPYGKLRDKLEYLCQCNGIRFAEQEESYTSRADFFSRDRIPVYKPGGSAGYVFSGKRIHRGMYRSGTGMLLNADINGALNILNKSSVVGLTALYSRGGVDTPARIRVA